ncbi:MAG: hypothetical protein V1772_03275 [Chloroflexota bacterium]
MSPGERQGPALDRSAIQTAEPTALGELMRPLLVGAYGRWEWADGSAHAPDAWYRLLTEAVQPEARSLDDLVALAAFAYGPRVTAWTGEAQAALAEPWAPAVFARCYATLSAAALASPEVAKGYFRDLRHALRDEAGLSGRQVMFPLRAALTGSMRGPCLGVVATLLGVVRCQQRIEAVWICG